VAHPVAEVAHPVAVVAHPVAEMITVPWSFVVNRGEFSTVRNKW